MLTIEWLEMIFGMLENFIYILIGIGIVFGVLFLILLNKINFLEDQLNTMIKNQSVMIEKMTDKNDNQNNS